MPEQKISNITIFILLRAPSCQGTRNKSYIFSYSLVGECLFKDFAHAFDWACMARRSSIRIFFIIFDEIRKSINSRSESQYDLIVPGLLGCFAPGSNFLHFLYLTNFPQLDALCLRVSKKFAID